MPSRELIESVAVTAELCGRTFSEAAARVFVSDLSRYPENQVIAALGRCRCEVKGVLTVSDVVSRLEDGRPGVEEAWGMIPLSESQTVVWTTEMAVAFGASLPLIERRDMVGARMAFKEAYTQAVMKARDHGTPVDWTASIGYDPAGRAAVLQAAVNEGKLPLEWARQHAPQIAAPVVHSAIAGRVNAAIGISDDRRAA